MEYHIYSCDKFRCEYWDSDQNGGHCICCEPPCKDPDAEHEQLNNEKKEPLG